MSAHVGIIGLGLTGLSLVRYYLARGWKVSVFDERPHPPQLAALRAEFPQQSHTQISGYDELMQATEPCDEYVASPGIAPHRLPPQLKLTSELDLFRTEWERHCKATATAAPCLITVTGTNGKSTVCELVAQLATAGGANAVAVGNIGIPVLDAVREWDKDNWPDCVVAELSSYQLAGAQQALPADVAVILNLSPDHLDWHGTLADYISAKERIFTAADCAVYDAADAKCSTAAGIAKRSVSFNSSASTPASWGIAAGQLVGPAGLKGPSVRELIDVGIMPAAAVAALTIVAAAYPAQEPSKHLAQLKHAQGLPHRLQKVATVAGITYVNDSKATNAASSIAALTNIGQSCVPIWGGFDKKQDFAKLAAVALQVKVPIAVLLGTAIAALQRALDEVGLAWQPAVTMREAVRLAGELARKHQATCVLLSPACASNDSYPSYAARGDDFIAAVEEFA